MINRFAFAALKGILCHFPGEKKLRQNNNQEEESQLGEGSATKKGRCTVGRRYKGCKGRDVEWKWG